MIVEILTYVGVGALLIVFGLLTWKKQMVTLLHSYHYKNVKQADIPAYAKQMGLGQLVIGAGLCLSGLLRLVVKGFLYWLPFVLGLAAGLLIFHKAQMKYNGSWF